MVQNLQIVLSGFGTGEQHLKLTTIMFQNIFPAIDINTVSRWISGLVFFIAFGCVLPYELWSPSICCRSRFHHAKGLCCLITTEIQSLLISATTRSGYNLWGYPAEYGSLCRTIRCLIWKILTMSVISWQSMISLSLSLSLVHSSV